jgi:hypothetical protein
MAAIPIVRMLVSDSLQPNLCGQQRQGKHRRVVNRRLSAGVAAPHLTSRNDRGTVPRHNQQWMM